MILILSDKDDVHANRVEIILTQRKKDFFRLNLDVESLKDTTVTFKNNQWVLSNKNKEININIINAIWPRRVYVELLLEEKSIEDYNFQIWKGEWNKTLLGIYASLENKRWLNFYRDAYYAENKYRQHMVAQKVGFNIPDFITSNKKKDLIDFAKQNSPVVLKLMNQDIYQISEGEFKGIYVNKITEENLHKFGSSSENPVTLQKYIDKSYEVRYTVVGSNHYVCRIDSQKSNISNTDWRRYDIKNTPHYQMTPPNHIKEKINSFLKVFNLQYGAFDFIVTPSNKWYFLELNSLGQYLWIEDLCGLTISEGIAEYLIKNK